MVGKEHVVFESGDAKAMVFGWGAIVLAVAVGVAIVSISSALSIAIMVLAGSGGASMVIWTSGKVFAGITLAKAEAKRIELEGKAAVIGARRLEHYE